VRYSPGDPAISRSTRSGDRRLCVPTSRWVCLSVQSEVHRGSRAIAKCRRAPTGKIAGWSLRAPAFSRCFVRSVAGAVMSGR